MNGLSNTIRHAIAVTAYNRPQLLDHLLASVLGADDVARWRVHVGVDPSTALQSNLEVIERYRKHLDIEVTINPTPLGVRRNPFATVERALVAGADAVLLLEDDLTIARDALTFCHALSASFLHAHDVLCANLLLTTCCSESVFDVADEQELPVIAEMVVRTRFFSSYGLLFSKAQWRHYFRDNWFNDQPRMENWVGGCATGWDVAMNRLLLTQPGLRVLQSLLPRVNHHGAVGTHVTSDIQARSFANVQLGRHTLRQEDLLRVVDPLLDFENIPSRQARLYLNLCRHLWQLQESSLAFKHQMSDFVGYKAKRFTFGKREFLLFKRRRAAN